MFNFPYQKILVVRLSSLGDILLTTPLIRSLKNANPKIGIHFLLREEYHEVLINNRYISKLITIKRGDSSSRTKDILHVMRLLGHRKIDNTLIYTQLVNFESNEYHSKVAKNVDEARRLIEVGFEHVCDFQGTMIFRKRK